MKSLGLFLCASGLSALVAVSCKNTDNNKLFDLQTATFSLSGTTAIPNDYQFIGNITCKIPNTSKTHDRPFTITTNANTIEYVKNSNECKINITEITINSQKFKPSTSTPLQYQFSNTDSALTTASSSSGTTAVKYTYNDAATNTIYTKFLNLKLEDNQFSLIITESKNGGYITSTSENILLKNTRTFVFHSLEAPTNPELALSKIIITNEDTSQTTTSYTFTAKNSSDYKQNNCRIVINNADLSSRETIQNAYNNSANIACPNLNTPIYLGSPSHIILGTKAPDNKDDSFIIYKIQ